MSLFLAVEVIRCSSSSAWSHLQELNDPGSFNCWESLQKALCLRHQFHQTSRIVAESAHLDATGYQVKCLRTVAVIQPPSFRLMLLVRQDYYHYYYWWWLPELPCSTDFECRNNITEQLRCYIYNPF